MFYAFVWAVFKLYVELLLSSNNFKVNSCTLVHNLAGHAIFYVKYWMLTFKGMESGVFNMIQDKAAQSQISVLSAKYQVYLSIHKHYNITYFFSSYFPGKW